MVPGTTTAFKLVNWLEITVFCEPVGKEGPGQRPGEDGPEDRGFAGMQAGQHGQHAGGP